MKKLILLALLFSGTASSTPFLVSNESSQTITHCAMVLDKAKSVETPAVLNAITNHSYCSFDLAKLAFGEHVVKVRFINIKADPIWGRVESTDFSWAFSKVLPVLTQPSSAVLLAK